MTVCLSDFRQYQQCVPLDGVQAHPMIPNTVMITTIDVDRLRSALLAELKRLKELQKQETIQNYKLMQQAVIDFLTELIKPTESELE